MESARQRGRSAEEGEIAHPLLMLTMSSAAMWEHREGGKGAECLIYLLRLPSCSVPILVTHVLGASLNPAAATSPRRQSRSDSEQTQTPIQLARGDMVQVTLRASFHPK